MKSAGSVLKFARRLRPLGLLLLTAGIVLLAGAVTTVSAATFTLGASAGADAGQVDCVPAYECDRSSTHVKLSAGVQIDDRWDVQLSYFDAGRFKGGDLTPLLGTPFGGDFKVDGIGLTGGYRYAFAPQWSVTGRAGLSSMRTRFEYAGPYASLGSVGERKVYPLLGLGLAYALTPQWRIGLDVDVTRFKVYQSRGTLQMFGIAAQYAF